MSNQVFRVDYWCAHPDKDNDSHDSGWDYDTLEEARKSVDNGAEPYIQYIILWGPNVHEITENPNYHDTSDDDWRHEMAMEAGMAFGCQGYNDFYGW